MEENARSCHFCGEPVSEEHVCKQCGYLLCPGCHLLGCIECHTHVCPQCEGTEVSSDGLLICSRCNDLIERGVNEGYKEVISKINKLCEQVDALSGSIQQLSDALIKDKDDSEMILGVKKGEPILMNERKLEELYDIEKYAIEIEDAVLEMMEIAGEYGVPERVDTWMYEIVVRLGLIQNFVWSVLGENWHLRQEGNQIP